MFSHIETDLDLSGISMGFASINKDECPDTVNASDGYYDRPEAHVPLLDGKMLHALLDGSNEIKLTLVDGTATKCIELGWVSHQVMRNAIEVDSRSLSVNGKELAFANVPRQLKRMLMRASA